MNILDKFGAFFERFTDWKFTISAIIVIAVMTIVFYFVMKLLRSEDNKILIAVYAILTVVLGIAFVLLDTVNNAFFLFVPVLLSMAFIFLYSTEIKHLLKLKRQQRHDVKANRKFDEDEAKQCIDEIIKALQSMSKKDIGALIILSKGNVSSQILDSGTKINSLISSELIETIFFKYTPLHDGAMVIDGTRIVSAGCFLPNTQNENLPKDLGTRHRAAIGITETTDVTALVVSEETGIISIAYAGRIERYADTEKLKAVLSKFYWQDLLKLKR